MIAGMLGYAIKRKKAPRSYAPFYAYRFCYGHSFAQCYHQSDTTPINPIAALPSCLFWVSQDLT
jgi:hypothetical protein